MPYGVTEQILESYAKIIIDLSLNKQVRRGDPIRNLNVEAWTAERTSTGLSDNEIAERIGLAVPQVTYIRNIVERRLFRTNQYRKLYRLGGGKRYRPGQYVDPEQALAIDADADALRRALVFDPQQVTRYVNEGCWGNETLNDLVHDRAREQPDELAFNADNTKLSWKELSDQVNDIAAQLGEKGLRRGNSVSIDLSDGPAAIILTLGALKNGNVALVVPSLKDNDIRRDLETVALTSARLGYTASDLTVTNLRPSENGDTLNSAPNYVSNILKSEFNQTDDRTSHAQGLATYRAVAGDMAMLLPAGSQKNDLVPHTHHTLVAGGRALAHLYADDNPDAIASDAPSDPSQFAALLSLWLQWGVPLILSKESVEDDRRTLNVQIIPRPSDIDLQASVLSLAFVGRVVEVLNSSETLACLYRETSHEAVWEPLSGVDVQQTDSTRNYSLRGPGFAPGYLRDKSKPPEVFQPQGWVQTRLDKPIRENG